MTLRKELFVSTISNGTQQRTFDNNIPLMNLYIVFENNGCPTINNIQRDGQQFYVSISNYINSSLERSSIIGVGIFSKIYLNDSLISATDKEFYVNNNENDIYETVLNYIQDIRYLTENDLN